MSPTAADDPLQQPVQFLPGVGPARAQHLEKLEIRTVHDLLWHLPRDVVDLTEVRQPRDLVDDRVQSVRGVIVDLDARHTSSGKAMVACLIECNGEYVRGTWFNQPWMLSKLKSASNLLFSGKPKKHQGRWEFSHPRLQFLSDDDEVTTGGIFTRYPLTEGLKLHDLHRLMRHAVEQFADQIPEHLPQDFLESRKLPTVAQAIRSIHLPTRIEQYDSGRHRILFDDLFEFQVGLALRRRAWNVGQTAPSIPVTAKVDSRIRRLFPFRLTGGQDQAIADVVADLARPQAMHRLVQADVGAGKTVIAVYAMLAAVAAGFQCVLMAPTELLASQHWETVERMLSQSRVQRALLTGRLSAADRRSVLEGIRSGTTQLVIGTQAVIQESVVFANLGLAVIDEQHKFGVAQRSHFSNAAESETAEKLSPHVLVMTATPIPRSLCLTQFGDLDMTLISELPPGRQRVVTSRLLAPKPREKAWEFLRKQIQEGRQLYVVCPKVGGDADDDEGSAERTFVELQAGQLKEFRIGLVHGRMDRDVRQATMNAFRHGDLDVLVSTTVIEVGVDVPNATLMMILQAERFGLSQLHQLRGRVARGKYQGYCFLDSAADTPEATSRLTALEQTSDGFKIAEADFELRGPGDVLGTRQHGDLPLQVADLIRDREILVEARKAAFELVESKTIDDATFAPLKLRVLDRFGKLMDLPRSG
jgi:ATP-dependent DNA helicase RecG